jgi:hypothetical protein
VLCEPGLEVGVSAEVEQRFDEIFERVDWEGVYVGLLRLGQAAEAAA